MAARQEPADAGVVTDDGFNQQSLFGHQKLLTGIMR
jgi:hypothetical protein